MTIPSTINDIHSAGQAWLRRKLEIEELSLPDYERRLAPDDLVRPEKHTVPFLKYMLP